MKSLRGNMGANSVALGARKPTKAKLGFPVERRLLGHWRSALLALSSARVRRQLRCRSQRPAAAGGAFMGRGRSPLWTAVAAATAFKGSMEITSLVSNLEIAYIASGGLEAA